MVYYYVAVGLGTAVGLAFWGALAVFSVWAYRHLRLPSIPWLAAYVLLRFVFNFHMPILMRYVTEGHPEPGTLIAATGLSTTHLSPAWTAVGGSINILSDAIIAWFLIAEFAFVLSKSSLAEGLSIPKMAFAPRNHPTRFGIALLASVLLRPLLLWLLWVV